MSAKDRWTDTQGQAHSIIHFNFEMYKRVHYQQSMYTCKKLWVPLSYLLFYRLIKVNIETKVSEICSFR